MKRTLIMPVLALVLCLFVPSVSVAADPPCFLCGFAESGPNRPPAEEDVYDADFVMIFGERPVVEGGRKVNLKDLAAAVQYDEFKRNFAGVADFDVGADLVERLARYTAGGFPVAWDHDNGRTYVAFIGIPTPLYRLSPHLFTNPNIGYPDVIVFNSIHRRRGCIPNFPSDAEVGRNLDAQRGRNNRLCQE